MEEPPNFGVVEEGLYRSGYPSECNLAFLQSLGLRTVLFVGPGENKHCEFYERCGIACLQVSFSGKSGLARKCKRCIALEVAEALAKLLQCEARPMLVHCNGGRHRSGRLIGCLRKLRGWSFPDIAAEYASFAGGKARAEDLRLIDEFDVSLVETRSNPKP